MQILQVVWAKDPKGLERFNRPVPGGQVLVTVDPGCRYLNENPRVKAFPAGHSPAKRRRV